MEPATLPAPDVDLQVIFGGGLVFIGGAFLALYLLRLLMQRPLDGGMAAILVLFGIFAFGCVLILDAILGGYGWLYYPAAFILVIGVAWYVQLQGGGQQGRGG